MLSTPSRIRVLVSGLIRTLAVSGNNLYAGGSFTTAGGNDARYIAAAVAQAVSPALNHAPTIDQVPSMTVPKNGSVQTVSLPGITAGPNEGGQAITMIAIAYNKGTNPADGQNDYIQNLALALPAGGSFVTKMDNSATNIVLTFMPTPDKIGTSTIRVELQDDGGTAGGGIDTTYMSFDVNIAEYNNPPTITIPTSAQTVSIQPGKSSNTIPITVGDAPGETPATDLILTFVSDTPALIPNTAINLAQTGTGANRGLIITPAPNAFGTAKVTATVTDTGLTSSPGVGVKSASIAISVTVIAAQAPFISQVSTNGVVTTNVVTAVNRNSDVIAFTVNDAQTLVPDGNIGFGGSDTNRLMIISPAVNQAGIAQITVTVQDTDGNTSSTTFQFTVVGTTPPVVNQPPSISKINDQTVVVGTSLPIITFTVSDDLTAVGDLKVTATSSNQSLIPANNISLGGNTGTRTLLLNLASGQTGVSSIMVTVTDNSTPALAASTSFNVTVTPKVQVVANDFNGDGSPDIILEDASGNLGVWFMNGEALISGNYLSPASVGSDWRVVGTGDFNAVGKTDLLFQKADGTLAMWYMDGGINMISSAYLEPASSGADWKAVAVADFNNNGKPDVLFQNKDGTLAVWYLNNGTLSGAAYLNPASPGSANWKAVGTGDFNGDGQPDILLQNTDGTLAVWYMNGVTLLSGEYLTPSNPGANWRVMGITDQNGDGKPDLLFQNSSDGSLAIWYMNGSKISLGKLLKPSQAGGTWQIVAP